MAKLTTAEFIESIKELSVLELNELVKACEDEFGVSALVSSVTFLTFSIPLAANIQACSRSYFGPYLLPQACRTQFNKKLQNTDAAPVLPTRYFCGNI